MQKLGEANKRLIHYIKINENPYWDINLPKSNWSVIIFANSSTIENINEAVSKCLEKSVLHIASIGNQSEIIEDIADENISLKEMNDMLINDNYPITTSHKEENEGLWSAIFVMQHSLSEINEVVILDISNQRNYENFYKQVEQITNDN
jgi:hypothetical protein